MTQDIDRFIQLAKRFSLIDHFGELPPAPPWGDSPTLGAVLDAIASGAPALPSLYMDGYVLPLVDPPYHRPLSRILLNSSSQEIEAITGAVYQHASASEVQQPLQRFLAVISNLYRSFLSKDKRIPLQIPLTSTVPPLAVFQSSGESGPFTLPCDETQALFGSTIGVVSLPSTLHDHPVLWSSLAHETGGHDVTHADPNLLPELARGVRTLFSTEALPASLLNVNPQEVLSSLDPASLTSPLSEAQTYGLLWSYWIDESTADIYGLLNIGPTFAVNLAAYFAAIRYRASHGLIPLPQLATSSSESVVIDAHPTDILRLHLAIGAIRTLSGLAPTERDNYIALLEEIAARVAPQETPVDVTIQGFIPISAQTFVYLNLTKPLAEIKITAQSVGAYLATAQLAALAGHSIQDIETWDDADESKAQLISATLQQQASVVDMGDDAQLLAGATLALFAQPASYDVVTELLARALDRSYALDPIWNSPQM
ncbi:MAG TPA: hypothetical protein VGD98_08055 [Ktedonobacteraceae bacterium]